MTYKNKDKQRETTKNRVKRFREKQKGVTVTPCPLCNDRGFIEKEAGLIMVKCKCRN